MQLLDLTLPTPAENLACDEALLDWREAEPGPDILRFWMPDRHFVVAGYATRIAREVNLDACRARQVPILRRCSGGGTVLQGPGCLNYALILDIEQWPGLRSVTQTNCFIMKRHATALASLPGGPVSVEGFTDLTVNGLKFSGNAQRRKRRCLLFHGTFLLHFDLSLVSQFLQQPSRQPAYRENRSHTDFLILLGFQAASIKAALQKVWNAADPLEAIPAAAIRQLVQAKYATDEWNLKW